MRYFELNKSSELSEVGNYPQTDFRKGYNPRMNGCFNVKSNEFPDFVPNYELQLLDDAILTDFVSHVGPGFGFVINKRVKDILSNFKLPRHHFYPTKLYVKDKEISYYWFHYIIDDFWKYLDTEDSFAEVFSISKGKRKSEKTFRILSSEQAVRERKMHQPNLSCFKKIKMAKKFPKYDLYQTRGVSYISIISEDLKDALNSENVTGIEIKPFPQFVV